MSQSHNKYYFYVPSTHYHHSENAIFNTFKCLNVWKVHLNSSLPCSTHTQTYTPCNEILNYLSLDIKSFFNHKNILSLSHCDLQALNWFVLILTWDTHHCNDIDFRWKFCDILWSWGYFIWKKKRFDFQQCHVSS